MISGRVKVVDQLSIPEGDHHWEKHDNELAEHCFIDGWEVHRWRIMPRYCILPIEPSPDWEKEDMPYHSCPLHKVSVDRCKPVFEWSTIIDIIKHARTTFTKNAQLAFLELH